MKKFLHVLLYLCLFGFLFYCVTVVFEFKNEYGIRQMRDFYRYDDVFDIIFIGSSHVGVNVDSDILAEEYGIESYNLWAAMQPAWNSYYYLKEALKTQTPELVCLDTYIISQDMEYNDYSYAIFNTFGMKPSLDKWEAIKVSIPEDTQMDLALGWPTFHTRYTELSEMDFEWFPWNYSMGTRTINSGYNSCPIDEPEMVADTETMSLYPKEEEYLRKFIELAQSNGIDVFLFTSPFSANKIAQMRCNEIQKIADEYGIRYNNYNNQYHDIGIDYSMDFADEGGHFNNYGIKKFTMYLGKYLRDTYKLPIRDRKAAAKYNLQKIYSKLAYRLEEMFEGNAANSYIDTKQTLYDDPNRSWTLVADFDTELLSDEKVYFSCFAEEESAYRGLLVKREDEKLYIIVGESYYIETEIPKEGYARLVIIKDGTSYTVYLNGELLQDHINTTCAQYDGPLVLGCEMDAAGEPYRYSAARIYEMEIYNEAISEKDALKWMKQERSNANNIYNQIQESVEYYLEKEFKGNGEDQFCDTGIHLYDAPDRNWTLLTEIDPKVPENSNDYVYLSCFSEEENNYRGLLLRQKDDKIELILGNNYYMTIPIEDTNTMKIAVVKNQSTYTVYVNGEEYAADISSYCSSYFGDLLLGCQEDTKGEKMRFSPVTVKQLEIYDEMASEAEIAAW